MNSKVIGRSQAPGSSHSGWTKKSTAVISDDAATTLAELAHHGASGSHTIRYSLDLNKANILDLTDPSIAKAWGYAGGDITPATQAIGIRAIEAGYNVIKFPSLRGPGTNYGVISDFNKILTPKMIVPTP
ncbi:RES family NAD+ phosphorylase [Luteolibacter ambystomatis]|uniref:RES family NAD+ phosphorylase n=1 Tax=Luteolibacter ambystomatis TaxID=2824561 RepID=A0A975J394_9BACT|nr:RES family NAD+ phosphorylase [Luteolibacter ambystomatis]QUE53194.1 RES family NAD+ phosphorylase [Luteolibacter ambystomatis]